MKSLYIVRHAKSSWEAPDLTDEMRPLLDKGVKRMYQVIEFLQEKKVKVDLLISSHAVRAYETAKLIAQGIGYPVDRISQIPSIYHGDDDGLLGVLADLPGDPGSVMMVGHNPGFTQFAGLLTGKEMDWLPTSAVVRIDITTDSWKHIMDSHRNMIFMIHPRMLK